MLVYSSRFGFCYDFLHCCSFSYYNRCCLSYYLYLYIIVVAVTTVICDNSTTLFLFFTLSFSCSYSYSCFFTLVLLLLYQLDSFLVHVSFLTIALYCFIYYRCMCVYRYLWLCFIFWVRLVVLCFLAVCWIYWRRWAFVAYDRLKFIKKIIRVNRKWN